LGFLFADIDVLINAQDVVEACRRLLRRGFEVVVVEPYTVTLTRGSLIVDLYTHPSFAWIVYVDGERLLEEIEEIG